MANTNTITQDLIDQITDNSSVTNSFTNVFDFDYNTNTFESSWSNIAQTVTDPYLSYDGKVTVNKNYLPTYKTKDVKSTYTNITAPPEYLTATITLYRGDSSSIAVIPVLFNASISNSISASYTKESPIGSSSPIVAFNYTGEETFPFNFVALSDYLPAGYNSLRDYINTIKEIVKPSYSDNLIKSPYVLLQFADISVKCVCESINISYDNIYNSVLRGGSFVKADIQCSFTRIRD